MPLQKSLALSGFCALLFAGACAKRASEDSAPLTESTAAAAPTPAATQKAAPVDAPTAAAPATAPSAIAAPPDVAAPPADAKKTPSGLATKVLEAGKGKVKPKLTDQVKVHYTGWTKGGTMFDSSVQRGQPIVFGVTGVIPGWTEGLQLMVVGEKRRMWIPGKLAYGDQPRMGAPAGDLTFDVELIEILSPPETPKDVAKPPADAKKTASGLAYKVLKKGTGKEHPSGTSRVTVHYTGWTTDGKMFDSSVTRGQPSSFNVGGVIKGWTEGLQLMVVGEKTRFWIPADLAYGETPKRPGTPAGMLVFDVELIDFK